MSPYQKILIVALFATVGGTCAKLAFTDNQVFILKIIFFILSIGSNTFQLSLFIDVMHDIGSVKATFLIKAMECCITALFGYVLFKEHLSYYWFIGTFLILTGFYMLQNQENVTQNKKKKQLKIQLY